MQISRPGIYRGIDVAIYHADPCPEPSLTQSIAKVLIARSPLHAAAAHPRLTVPAHAAADGDEGEGERYDKAKAIGDAAHALLIGRGKSIDVCAFDTWRSKEAKAAREAAVADGQMPILQSHFAVAEALCRSAIQQLRYHAEAGCFMNGHGEVALIWQEGDLWFRCLVDWLHDDLRLVDDYKTSAMSVAPHVLAHRASEAGWHIQAAMIERGLDALDPDNAGRRKFRFIAHEQEAPYALNVMVMTEAWLTMGRKQLDYAIGVWSRCLRAGVWPGYAPVGVSPEFPGWKESQWLAREVEEAERVPADLLNAG